MKLLKSTLNIFLVLLTLNSLSAQITSNWCGTEHSEVFMERLKQNKVSYYNSPLKLEDREPTFVPIQIHIVSDGNGNGGAQEIDLAEFVGYLNAHYIDYDLQFFLEEFNNSPFNYFSNQSSYDDPSSTFGELAMNSNRNSSAVNLYITNTANTNGNNEGTVLGFYDPSRDWIVSRKINAKANDLTLIHEMGHFFSLAHPHLGWECQSYDIAIHGNPVIREYTNCPIGGPPSTSATSFLVELADGSNCEDSGDLLCDTPPDYNFGLGWSNCVPFNLDILDPNGDLVDPMENNVMGYFFGCDDYEFTDMQTAMIMEDFNSPSRNYLQGSFNPNTDSVQAMINYSYPLNDEVVDANDPIELDWINDPAVDYYVVLLARNVGLTIQRQKFIIQASEITLDNLENDKTYYYSVFGFNVTGSHTTIRETVKFTTSELTSTKDIKAIDALTISPNPVVSNQNAILKIDANYSFNAEVVIRSTEGKVFQNFKHVITQGLNNINLNLQNAVAGIYFVSIETPEGIRSKKLIITE